MTNPNGGGHLSNEELETLITDKGLTAPRITPEDLEDAIDPIAAIQYYQFPGTTVTVCCVPMRNGFTVVGESACASPENFDQEVGQKMALNDAMSKMWPLLGYALRDKLQGGEHV